MKPKVFFLDIDGVLNSHDWYARRDARERPQDEIDPAAVARLDAMCEKAEASIVISSSWRILYSVVQIQGLLISKGLSRGRILGVTPRLDRGNSPRGLEIDAWLKKNQSRVESFVIIDDDSDMEPHMDRLVKTNYDFGLTDAKVEEALEMLRRPL